MIPGKLHLKAGIHGDDGFVMSKYIYIVEKEPFDQLMERLKVKNPIGSSYYSQDYLCKMFVKYLKRFCADSFCVGCHDIYPTEEDNYTQKFAILIGFRSKKDLFKFNIRFGAKRIRWWRSSIPFTVVGTATDPYEKREAGEKWNKEDPQGFIR